MSGCCAMNQMGTEPIFHGRRVCVRTSEQTQKKESHPCAHAMEMVCAANELGADLFRTMYPIELLLCRPSLTAARIHFSSRSVLFRRLK